MIKKLCVLVVLLVLLPSCTTQMAVGRHGSGHRGAVSAGGAEAVEAGMAILRSGGNAADAAAATLLALSVTDSAPFGFGGEVPILVYDARRRVVEVLGGQGAAPHLATVDYFKKRGHRTIPGGGAVAATVPAVLDAIVTALDRYGTMTFSEIAEPTLSILAGRRAQWHKNFAETLRRLIEAEKAADGDRKRGLRLVADYFYRGPIAREIEDWSLKNGGLLRYSDLARHVTRIEEPLKVNYRGYEVYKCGPWTQGPYLLETLRLLEPFDIKGMGHNSADYIHLVTEALKLGLADRDEYYGDPLFTDVPTKALLSREYAALRYRLIDMKKASAETRPGDPRRMKALLDKSKQRDNGAKVSIRDTTTCVVVDRWGNMVVATPSGWGGPIAGKTGVKLGSRLQSLNLWPGHPNCLEPGKRPRTTLTPTIVLKNGKAVMGISVAGGDMQDQVALQLLLNKIEFGLEVTESLAAPRFYTEHHVGSFRQRPPQLGSLRIYRNVGGDTTRELAKRGHRISAVGDTGQPSIITVDPRTGFIRAAGDADTDRHAAVF